MTRSGVTAWVVIAVMGTVVRPPAVAAAATPVPDGEHAAVVAPYLRANCVACHNEKKHKGDVRLDDLAAEPGTPGDRWQAIAVQIRDGLMPPPDEPRPDQVQSRKVLTWIVHRGQGVVARLPNQGNLLSHELLFGKPVAAAEADAAARVWRLSPAGYMGFAADLGRGRVPVGVVQPFTTIPDRGIKDFAALYSVDEPSAEILVRNAEVIVNAQTGYSTIKVPNVANAQAVVKEFAALMKTDPPPTRPQLEAAVQLEFRLAIGRAASAEEVARLLGLYDNCATHGDTAGAARTMLQAVLLRTDAIFRSELGRGGGRRMLAPPELAQAISLALGDRREPGLFAAAAKGELSTREQVAAQVRRVLGDPKVQKTRVLQFFREYFEYDKAADVFKDKPKDFSHNPAQYVKDTDRLILAIVAEDRDVFRQLLTTDKSFVNFATKENKQTRKPEPVRAVVVPPKRDDRTKEFTPVPGVEYVYGLDGWSPEQPVTLPAETRIGILMQPSWLTAWSTNFDNDPVRRGRWVRERLLGGVVPELPIGVAAQVLDEPHRTFRDRLTVTRAANCWKCHRQMDELGLPFENFDHYGRFRTTEAVVDPEAMAAAKADKKGKPQGRVFREVTLNTAGEIAGSGDPKLDGAVKDPREMIRRIAGSDLARQVFIRHAFRFYMGRNETLSDAKTLQDADAAYLKSDGSFTALLVSFLMSDSFLYRIEPLAAGEQK